MARIHVSTQLYSHEPLRITIEQGGKSLRFHGVGQEPHQSRMDVYLLGSTEAELAAWQALADTLAALDVPVKEDVA